MPNDSGKFGASAKAAFAPSTRRLLWPALCLLLLLLFNLLFTHAFFHIEIRDHRLYGVPIDILKHGSKVMLLALGMTLVIATGGVDLSVGAVMAIAGAVAAVVINRPEHSFALAVAAALAVSLLAGLWNGLLVGIFKIQPIVATLVLMVAGRGVAQLITDGQIVTFTDPALVYLGNGRVLGLPFPIVLVAFTFIVITLATRRTALGLFIEAVGDSPVASRFAGINPALVKLLCYMCAGLCAGLAGLVAAADIRGADSNHAGLFLELDAILAVVIGGAALNGGRFSLVGSLLGALIIQTLTTTMYMRDVSADIAPVPKALVVLIVCLAQSPEFRKFLFPRAARANRVQFMQIRPQRITLLATSALLGAIYLFGCLRYDNFASARVLLSLLGDNSFLGIAAIGATLVILSGGIDLSVGAVVAFTSTLIASLIEQHHVAPGPAIALALFSGLTLGLGMGVLIARFGLPPFLVTLAGMFLVRGLAFMILPQSMGIQHPFFAVTIGNLSIPITGRASLPFTAICFLLLCPIAYVVASHTRFGRIVYALGSEAHSAALLGLPVRRTRTLVYAISGLLSACAGVVYTFYTQAGDPAACVGFELDAIAAVVIGGTFLRGGVGSVIGTIMGVLILGLIQTLVTFQGTLNTWWTRIVIGLLVLLFVGLQNLLTLATQRRAA